MLGAFVDLVLQLPLDQAAVVAGVTLLTAGILYLLLDALRYRAIPDLNVPLNEGVYDQHRIPPAGLPASNWR